MNAPPIRTAEVIAVGSELLGSSRVDTNSLYLADRLAAAGIELTAKAVVGDDRRRLGDVFRHALDRADLVILTGGLGPTSDDVTRDAVADVLERPLEEDPALVQVIAARFAKRGLSMPEVNRRQALVPRGGRPLQNPNGSAPGLLIEHGSRVVVLLPGPPRELQPMFDAVLEGPLAGRLSGERTFTASLFVAGRGESHVEELAEPVYSRWREGSPPIETTILAVPGQVELHLRTRSADEQHARRVLADAQQQLVKVLGRNVFSTDGRPMEAVVGDLLGRSGMTIAVAESCTGGLLCSRLTDVPGSSAWVLGGVAAYSNEAKTIFAGVDPQLIATYGAVSEPVGVALAENIRTRTGAAIGVGVTGIAGPSGGTPEKPVGTVVIAVALPDGETRVRSWWFPGVRAQVKFAATQAALDTVRRAVEDLTA